MINPYLLIKDRSTGAPDRKKLLRRLRVRYLFYFLFFSGLTAPGIISHSAAAFFFSAFALAAAIAVINPLWLLRPVSGRRTNMDQIGYDLLQDPGNFEYDDHGFSMLCDDDTRRYIAWHEISFIFGYKRDDYTTDAISMEVFCALDLCFAIDEEVAGFYKFKDCLANLFPITKKWEYALRVPVFETGVQIIYTRDNRSPDEVDRLAAQYAQVLRPV